MPVEEGNPSDALPGFDPAGGRWPAFRKGPAARNANVEEPTKPSDRLNPFAALGATAFDAHNQRRLFECPFKKATDHFRASIALVGDGLRSARDLQHATRTLKGQRSLRNSFAALGATAFDAPQTTEAVRMPVQEGNLLSTCDE